MQLKRIISQFSLSKTARQDVQYVLCTHIGNLLSRQIEANNTEIAQEKKKGRGIANARAKKRSSA